MKAKRKNFTEIQKATIYARDRATCAFSTVNLWILDEGIKSNRQNDWVDHIKPCASGGGSELENGICASEFFNSKKKANSLDNQYFLKDGALTKCYLSVFGTPPDELMKRLDRLKNLAPLDWYYNRSILGVFVGYDCRCDKEFKGIEYKRNDEYWFKSAWKRLDRYQKKKGPQTITERGLVKEDIPFGTSKLLELETIYSYDGFMQWVEEAYAPYRESYKAFHEYDLISMHEKGEYIDKLGAVENLHPGVKSAIRSHYITNINL
jgi:hypothetical protein